MLIRSLKLENFRAFPKASLNLAPLTILVGPNNAGKSSIISSIRLLSQTLISADPEARLLLEELGSFPDVVHGYDAKKTVKFRLDFEREEGRLGLELSYDYRSQRRQVILRGFRAFESIKGRPETTLIETSYSKSSERQILQKFEGIDDSIVPPIPLFFIHFFPRATFQMINELDRVRRKLSPSAPGDPSESAIKRSSNLNRKFREMQSFLESLQYLGPFRQPPFRLYPFTGERLSKLGPTGSEAPDVLMNDYFQRGRSKKRVTNEVTDWLKSAGIASKVQVKAISPRHFDVKMQHPITRELSNLADVGYGASQILPVLLGGYGLMRDSLFMVEQPELHIHPKAQAELGEFFCSLVERGVQSIVETHSEHLILRIQQKVGSGELNPEDVAVSYINPTAQGKEIVDLPMNRDGLFTKPWPGGFFEERKAEALNLARAPILRKRKSHDGDIG
jgi:predicted ATPase